MKKEGWAFTTLDELAACTPRAITDGPFGSALKTEHYTKEGARVIRLANIGHGRFLDTDRAYVDAERFEALRNHEVVGGDLVTAALGDPLGRTCIVPLGIEPALVKADCFRLRPHPAIQPDYLCHWLNSPVAASAFVENSHGVGRTRITLTAFRAAPVPLAPSGEQRRIVEKIDALSARSKRARADLDRVEALAARAKQAVLAAAVRGHLTDDWRQSRSESWTDHERAELVDRRTKYLRSRRGSRLERAASALETIPKDWVASIVGATTDLISGFAFKSEWFSKEGVRLLRGVNVAPGCLDWTTEARLPTIQAEEFQALRVEHRDVILAMDRPLISSGLKVAMATTEDAGCLLVQRVARIRASRFVLPDYLYIVLQSDLFRGEVERTATGSDLPHVSQNDIASAPMPLPPLAEQAEICTRVKRAISKFETSRREAGRSSALLDRLDQSLLAKAFRGELVPQDPADEPASVLLDRIRAERTRTDAPKRRGRQSRVGL